ncbi:MAG: hypothetical protein H6977_08915 [Gammaproteobacteria bacterium]|nr:hypothetical protein [Gammaproteobacteria bacterium]MCP5200123.1 hypothetical protein [Gammaproteobacteria bacterium]
MAGAAATVTQAGLGNEPVYVFGTDLGGQHQGESAAMAAKVFGAETGKASGATGHAYAIPFRNSAGELLPAEVIKNYVDSFFAHAQAHPQTLFHVARFACEAQAHDDATLARLFARAPANCLLPGLWTARLNAQQAARLLVFDAGAHLKDAAWQRNLKGYLDLNAPLWNVKAIELVTVGSARTVVANDVAAKALGLKHRVFGQNESAYGREAALVAEHKAIWYCTHLLSILDFEQTAQPQQVRMLGAAARNGLAIDQLSSTQAG